MENLRCRVVMLGVQECIARVLGFRVGVRAKRMGGGVLRNADAGCTLLLGGRLLAPRGLLLVVRKVVEGHLRFCFSFMNLLATVPGQPPVATRFVGFKLWTMAGC